MGKIAAAAAVFTAAAVTLAAQDSTPVFRAGTTLVEFTIVATDRDGQPVTDLTQNDVTIVQNGKPQPVAFFRFEGSAFGPGAVEASHEPIAPGIFTNRSEYFPGPARNVTAIVIDTLNTVPEDQVAVKAHVMQYLRALALLASAFDGPLAARDCAAIEDSRWGLDSARAAGMWTVGIAQTYPPEELAGADLVVATIADLDLRALAALCK